MGLAEAIAEAKADLPAVQNKLRGVIQQLERAHRKNRRGGDQVAHTAYTTPEGNNNWLAVITTNKKQTLQNFLMYIPMKEGFFGL